MKKLFKLTFLCLLLFVTRSTFAQDEMIREERKVSGFSAIKISGIAHVVLSKGESEKVNIEINNKDFKDRLRTEVVDGVLVIRMENSEKWDGNYRDVKLDVYVTYKTLKSVQASGATSVDSKGMISASRFDLKLSGANNSTLQVEADELNVEANGASNVNLSGKADRLTVRSSGASNIKAYELKAKDVKADASGVSNIYISAQDTLAASATGFSNVTYDGDARLVSKDASKMANVRKK